MRARALLLVLLALAPPRARAEVDDACERCALAPNPDARERVARGGLVHAEVRVATALALPPGVQSERALTGFAARACPERALPCTSLRVERVRPVDAHSLVYRMELRIPATLAEGVHDLALRFPGGEARIARAVEVRGEAPTTADAPGEAPVTGGVSCTISGTNGGSTQLGLLLVLVSWKLAARRRVSRWNSARRPSVSRGT